MITEEVLVACVATWDKETPEEFAELLEDEFDANTWVENEHTVALCIEGIEMLSRGSKVIKFPGSYELVVLNEDPENRLDRLRWQEFYEGGVE